MVKNGLDRPKYDGFKRGGIRKEQRNFIDWLAKTVEENELIESEDEEEEYGPEFYQDGPLPDERMMAPLQPHNRKKGIAVVDKGLVTLSDIQKLFDEKEMEQFFNLNDDTSSPEDSVENTENQSGAIPKWLPTLSRIDNREKEGSTDLIEDDSEISEEIENLFQIHEELEDEIRVPGEIDDTERDLIQNEIDDQQLYNIGRGRMEEETGSELSIEVPEPQAMQPFTLGNQINNPSILQSPQNVNSRSDSFQESPGDETLNSQERFIINEITSPIESESRLQFRPTWARDRRNPSANEFEPGLIGMTSTGRRREGVPRENVPAIEDFFEDPVPALNRGTIGDIMQMEDETGIQLSYDDYLGASNVRGRWQPQNFINEIEDM
ncbi:hypothetical protein AA313_de0207547 [Arthrobotrys entomopaga]|nr:hypothetical protein AA313_de0207547 [Arthrobotrys entomopaga]